MSTLRIQKPRQPLFALVKTCTRQYLVGLFALIIVDVINVIIPLMIRDAIDAISSKESKHLYWSAGLLFGIMVFQSLGRYVWRVYLMGASYVISTNVREGFYKHLQNLPLSFYQKYKTGDFMSRATNDIESIRLALGPGVLVAVDAIVMFGLIVPAMFWLSPKLALLSLIFFPFVPFLTTKIGNKIETLFGSLQDKLSQMSAYAQEIFGSIRLIKSLVLENSAKKHFENLSLEYQKEGLVLAKSEAIFSPVLSWITNMGTFFILLFGGMDVIHGAMTLGTFIAFQRFVVQLSWPMEAIGWAVTMNQEGTAAYGRIREIMGVSEIEDLGQSTFQPVSNGPLLEIRNLNYKYTSQNESFNLHIPHLSVPPNRKIGIVGPMGSGKSTLFNLILRLYEPTRNQIFIWNKEVADYPLKEIRKHVSSVEQQVSLFNDSIIENIRLGNEGLNEKRIWDLLNVCELDKEILFLPQGLETLIGERGITLSGGQKQRLALCRALGRNPDLLLLDDAFSAVDMETENKIIQKFLGKFPNLTLLFSSHRLSIMPHMDEIWVFDKGTCIAQGSHSELIKSQAMYQELWSKSEYGTAENPVHI